MDTKEQIKEIAGELFAHYGYDGVSVRDIIEKAHVNLGAITYHFGSKEDLYREIISEMGLKLLAGLKNLNSKGLSSSQKLESYIRLFMTLVLNNPTQARMMIREMGMGGKRFMEIMGPFAKVNFSALRDILDEGMRKREFQKMDTQLASVSILALCVHFMNVQPMILQVTGKTEYNNRFIETIINHTVQFALNSVTK